MVTPVGLQSLMRKKKLSFGQGQAPKNTGINPNGLTKTAPNSDSPGAIKFGEQTPKNTGINPRAKAMKAVVAARSRKKR